MANNIINNNSSGSDLRGNQVFKKCLAFNSATPGGSSKYLPLPLPAFLPSTSLHLPSTFFYRLFVISILFALLPIPLCPSTSLHLSLVTCTYLLPCTYSPFHLNLCLIRSAYLPPSPAFVCLPSTCFFVTCIFSSLLFFLLSSDFSHFAPLQHFQLYFVPNKGTTRLKLLPDHGCYLLFTTSKYSFPSFLSLLPSTCPPPQISLPPSTFPSPLPILPPFVFFVPSHFFSGPSSVHFTPSFISLLVQVFSYFLPLFSSFPPITGPLISYLSSTLHPLSFTF